MVRDQTQMLLFYCQSNLTPNPQALNNPNTDRQEIEIDKHEPSNYDDNLPAKLERVWELLIKPAGQGDPMEYMLGALYRRILDLYLTLMTSVFL
jgi:hypothetical protein